MGEVISIRSTVNLLDLSSDWIRCFGDAKLGVQIGEIETETIL